MDELRDNWRPLFHERFSPLVKNATGISEAALLLNQHIWPIWNITFKANQTPDIMSQFQVVSCCHPCKCATEQDQQTRASSPELPQLLHQERRAA